MLFLWELENAPYKKANAPYERSLGYFAKLNDKHYLIDEFSNKNNIEVDKIYYSSNDKFIWNCNKCNSEYNMSVNARTSGNSNCPYCAGMRVNETNCIWTTHPEVAALLKYSSKGYELTKGSHKYEIFICPLCRNEKRMNVSNVIGNGIACSKCSDGISYPEKFLYSFLTQINIEFEIQKTFEFTKKVKHINSKISGNKKYDFYIPSLSMIIEAHGAQHYEENGFRNGRSLKDEIENDKLKEKLARKNNIDKYIVIDCKKSDLDYIKNNILKSLLNSSFDLSNVDWLKCHEYACSSRVKEVCEYFNSLS